MSGVVSDPVRRLSLNQMTTRGWALPDLVDGCRRAGIGAVGLWREPVAEHGLARTRRLVDDAGMRVSSLCRGGFLTGTGPEAAAAREDNRRAVDEAASLGAACLVLVVGGLPDGSRDLPGARQRVADAVQELATYAAGSGVRLALEPLHPMYCADRAVLSTLGQALDLVEALPAAVGGVVVDAFHVWWDPDLDRQLARAGARIASLQLGDWVTPLADDVLLSRGLMGDGHIDLAGLHAAVDSVGYRGDVEVEIFNEQVWATPPEDVVTEVVRRYRALAPAAVG